jgi:hypothetical protein
MSCGLATTRRTARRDWRSTSATQSVNEGLGRGHHHLLGRHLHRQHLVALGIGRAHGVGHLAHVHLERVDAQVGQARALGQVLRSAFRCPAACRRWRAHGHAGQAHQRVLRAFGLRAARNGALAFVGEITPSARSQSTMRRQSSGPTWIAGAAGAGFRGGFSWGLGRRCNGSARGCGRSVTTGLNTRSHLAAGRPQRAWMASARAAARCALGRLGVRCASTTVLPSRVGLKAQSASSPKAPPCFPGCARSSTRGRTGSRSCSRPRSAARGSRHKRRGCRAPARRPRGRTGPPASASTVPSHIGFGFPRLHRPAPRAAWGRRAAA